MRILLHDYAGHPFQVQLSRELARRGHEVLHAYAGELQTPRGALAPDPDDPPTFSIEEVPMDPNYTRYKYSFARRRRMEINYGKEAARLVQRWKPDAVISANTPTESQATILRQATNSGSRFISWVQDVYSVAVSDILRKRVPVLGEIAGRYYRHLDRSQFQRSHHIVAIADDFKSLLIKDFDLPEGKISVIPNWAPLESLPTLPKSNPWSIAEGLDEQFCFLYSGTLGMKHNPDLLLQLALKYRDVPDVRVVVISEGIGSSWLREKRDAHGLENLLLLPYQPFDQMPQVLATGDVLIGILEPAAGTFSVPSKVLTYLCARRPLLLAVPSTNLASQIATGAGAAQACEPHDTDAFLAGAATLRDSPPLREKMAKNARNYAERTFKISKIAVNFENIINS
jgi:colanic acid biosynthesis glycosyl transferase WcaI